MKKRLYKSPMFGTFDLDDPKTYKYLPNTSNELDDLMFKQIGYAMVYMDFFSDRKGVFPKKKQKPRMIEHPYSKNKIDAANGGYEQRQRVYKLIENFAKNRKNNYDNLMWYKEQIFLFQDEIENMC